MKEVIQQTEVNKNNAHRLLRVKTKILHSKLNVA